MRIAMVSATFPPYQGGTGNVCWYNARELAQVGHDVHVLTVAVNGAAPTEERDGVSIHRLKALFRVGNASVPPGLVTRLRRFDLIHLHYPFIGGAEIVWLAAVIHRVPLIITFHNDLIGNGLREQVFGAYQRVSTGLVIRHARVVCAVSHDHFSSSNACKQLDGVAPLIIELPNGVDTELFSPGRPDANILRSFGVPNDKHIVLFVAALDRAHHFKGMGRLLQVAPSLPHDACVVIAGDGDMRSHYERAVNLAGLSDKVVFCGNVSHDQLPSLYRRAVVTVLPSDPPESFGLVLIESMACATPVVASDIPGVRTVVDHGVNGFLVQPGDSGELAGAINRIVNDENVRMRFGSCGRSKALSHYDWRRIGETLNGVYETVLGTMAAETA